MAFDHITEADIASRLSVAQLMVDKWGPDFLRLFGNDAEPSDMTDARDACVRSFACSLAAYIPLLQERYAVYRQLPESMQLSDEKVERLAYDAAFSDIDRRIGAVSVATVLAVEPYCQEPEMALKMLSEIIKKSFILAGFPVHDQVLRQQVKVKPEAMYWPKDASADWKLGQIYRHQMAMEVDVLLPANSQLSERLTADHVVELALKNTQLLMEHQHSH